MRTSTSSAHRQSERRQETDRTEKSFCFFYIAFFFFFPDSPTQLRVSDRIQRALLAALAGSGGCACTPRPRSVVTSRSRPGFRRGRVAPGKSRVEASRGSKEATGVLLLPSLFLLLSLWAFLWVQGIRTGWMDREAGGARAGGNGKEVGGCR